MIAFRAYHETVYPVKVTDIDTATSLTMDEVKKKRS